MRRAVWCIAAMLGTAGLAFSQDVGVAALPGTPDSQTKGGATSLSKMLGVQVGDAPVVMLPALENALLKAEEERLGDPRQRVSVHVDSRFDWTKGRFIEAPGGVLWVLDYQSPTAYGLRPLVRMNLPAGAQMSVFPADAPEQAPWPYEGKGPHDGAAFWARTAYSNRMRVEVFLPGRPVIDPAFPPIAIDGFQHIYRNPLGEPSDEFACHNDVTCYGDYAGMARGVARMFFIDGGGFVCSGQLMNAINGDRTPYFLTANHCLSTQAVANTLETYWLYQTGSCNGTVPSLGSVPRADDATLLATGTASDFTFLMVEGTILRSLWWQGWTTAQPAFGEAVFGVHHPDGSHKRISFGSNSGLSPFFTPPCGSLSNHLRISWSSGTTEGGSSGSGVYRTVGAGDFRLVAQSHCSRLPRTCPGTSPESDKGYGRLDISYPSISGLLNGGSDDGYEGNDSCAAARYLGGVQSAFDAGLIVKSTSVDWYSFDVPAGGSATFIASFTHAWGDVDMQLSSACGTVVAGSGGTTNSERIDYTNTSSFTQRVYLNVFLYNDTRNTYNMTRIVRNPGVPENNDCGNNLALSLGTPVNGTTFGATPDGSATCGSSNTTGDVWYSFRSTCAGQIDLNTFGSGYDTVLSVHTGCPGTTTNQVVCNDDSGGVLQSSVSFNAAANTNYYVRVGGYNGRVGNFVLNSSRPSIANDACSSPNSLVNGVANFTTCGASTDGPPDDRCNAFGDSQVNQDVWFNYTATCTGAVTVSLAGSNFDTKVAAYNNSGGLCPAENTAIACNDDFGGTLQSQITFDSVAGAAYVIRVGGYRGAAGDVRLSIGCARTCIVDLNGDGGVDFNDYLEFLNLYNANNLRVDFNGDGGIDFNDYLEFLNLYNAGC